MTSHRFGLHRLAALLGALILSPMSVVAAGLDGARQAASALDASSAYAFPVPFRASQSGKAIHFINLPSQATIRIFNAAGELVRTLHEIDGDGQLDWDVTNESGTALASDVFFYAIESDESVKKGKLVVLR
jgi:hypothetical protein